MPRLLPLIAGALALAACGESSAPVAPPPPAGTYRLVSVGGRPLPATAACGVFRVVEGSLSLDARGRAGHHLRYVEPATGREIAYAGTGNYRADDEGVWVSLHGRWSHAPESHASELRLRWTGEGLVRIVGGECDAAEEELYRAP